MSRKRMCQNTNVLSAKIYDNIVPASTPNREKRGNGNSEARKTYLGSGATQRSGATVTRRLGKGNGNSEAKKTYLGSGATDASGATVSRRLGKSTWAAGQRREAGQR